MDANELRYLTYSRGDIYDRTIDTEHLQHDCPLDQTSLKSPSAADMRDATASLGRFDKLPVETIQAIFTSLDLYTLTLLRSISKRMNLLVESVLPYKEVFTQAPDALRALLSTGAARYFTAIDLQNALRAQDCFLCDRFGPFLYLLRCRRCCWRCLSSSEGLLPIAKGAAQSLYHLDVQTMVDIPTVVNIPDSYGPKQRRKPEMRTKGGKRIALVAFGSAVKLHDSMIDGYEKAKLETRIALRGPVSQDFMRDMDCMNYDPAGYNGGYGLEPQRFMAAVRFPMLIAGTDAVEWGVSCLGCLERAKEGDEERFWNEQYTNAGMVAHLAHCQEARQSWVNDRVKELHKR